MENANQNIGIIHNRLKKITKKIAAGILVHFWRLWNS
jgi:hypothetical protein